MYLFRLVQLSFTTNTLYDVLYTRNLQAENAINSKGNLQYLVLIKLLFWLILDVPAISGFFLYEKMITCLPLSWGFIDITLSVAATRKQNTHFALITFIFLSLKTQA